MATGSDTCLAESAVYAWESGDTEGGFRELDVFLECSGRRDCSEFF